MLEANMLFAYFAFAGMVIGGILFILSISLMLYVIFCRGIRNHTPSAPPPADSQSEVRPA